MDGNPDLGLVEMILTWSSVSSQSSALGGILSSDSACRPRRIQSSASARSSRWAAWTARPP